MSISTNQSKFLIICMLFALTRTQLVVNSEFKHSFRFNVNRQGNPRAFEPIVLVHGGAGDIPDSRDMGKHNGTRIAVKLGYAKLEAGGTAMDAVEAAVRSMELDTNFNAGLGSVLNIDGVVSMDASIMDGSNLSAGAVTMVEDILHPITLARRVLTNSVHTFLGGEGAMAFAKEQNIKIMIPKGQLVTQSARDSLAQFKADRARGIDNTKTETGHQSEPEAPPPQVDFAKDIGEVGTVGAVAIDMYGNIAAATSTGGMTGKAVGRIGDSPIIGSGTYADNISGGVSTTGHGETILRYNVAQRILQRIEQLGESAQVATQRVLNDMTTRLKQTAGAITIDKNGEVGIAWTSEKMAWAYQKGQTVFYGIKHGENLSEPA